MGGKHKQAQRTKNNVRPSSSGRSAELLGGNASTFVGFSSMEDGGYVPALPGFLDEMDSSINPNFHLVLKKMNKKDSTTKLKALNEFGALCRESEPAAVKVVLQFWPRLYCVLATDTEHRVREAAHNAHRAVVSSVGRSIAPYLKQIAGAWFTSQYDTYPPAASAASLSFQETFPPNKLTEAIIFCQEEIMNYIIENLTIHTPQTLSNPKTTTAEEMEAKYQRVIVSSLHGYGFYLSKLPEEQLQKAEELNKKLLGNSKFWKFAKHEASIVRVAWFTAIVNLCEKASFFLINEKKRVITAVLNNLDDSDSVVLPVVWEATLHIIVTIQDWPEHVSAEKLLFPKLWRILKEGGLGSAVSIFPNILPLLSKVPQNLIGEKKVFYSRFFSCLQEGLKHRNIQISTGESEAVAECYIECFGYIVMQCSEDLELCTYLISEQLIHLIGATLMDSKLQLFSRALYRRLVVMLVQWSKNKQDSYSQLLTIVFSKMISICCKSIDDSCVDRKQMENVLRAQVDLINALKSIQSQKQRKRLRVTFSEENSVIENAAETNENLFDDSPAIYQSEAHMFVKELMGKYFSSLKAVESCKKLFVRQLTKVVSVFNTKDVFLFLILLSGENKSWNDFYNEYLTVWLKDEEISDDDVSGLIFSLLKYVESDENQSILHLLNQNETRKVLEWSVKNENSNFKSVKEWLLSDNVDSIILSIVEEAVSADKNNNAGDIIKSCMRKTEEGSVLIKYNTVVSVLNYLEETIRQFKPDENVVDIESVADLIVTILDAFEDNTDNAHQKNVVGITLECFKFSLNQNSYPVLSKIWMDSVTRLGATNDVNVIKDLTHQCSLAIKSLLVSSPDVPEKELDIAIDQTIEYLQAVEKSNCDYINELVKIFLDELLVIDESVDNFMYEICYCTDVVVSHLGLPVFRSLPERILNCDFSDKYPFTYKTIFTFVAPALYTTSVILRHSGDNGCLWNKLRAFKNIDVSNYITYTVDGIVKYATLRVIELNFKKSHLVYKRSHKMRDFGYSVSTLASIMCSKTRNELVEEFMRRGHTNLPIGAMCAEALNYYYSGFLEMEYTDNQVLDMLLSMFNDTYPKSDVLLVWLPQLFTSGVGYDAAELSEDSPFPHIMLLCCHLRYHTLRDDSIFRTIYTDYLERIFQLGSLETYEAELTECSLAQIEMSANIAELLAIVVKNYINDVYNNPIGWDFVMISTASWIMSFKNFTFFSAEKSCSLPILQFLYSVCNLFKSVSDRLTFSNDSQLYNEWNDVFLADIHNILADVWVNIAENSCAEKTHPLLLVLANILSEIMEKHIKLDLFVNQLNILEWFVIFCQNLQSPIMLVHTTAYKLLQEMIPKIVNRDSECCGKEESEEEKGEDNLSLVCIEEILKHLQTIVDTMFIDFKLGDTCIVEKFTDGYFYAKAYLMLWLILLEICNKAGSQLRFMYTNWIKRNNFLGSLMKALFCLMPEEVKHCNECNVKHYQCHFTCLDAQDSFRYSDKLSYLSCWTYYKLLGRLPAEVRQWWSEIDHKDAMIVERTTSMFVSPLLCADELKAVRQEGKKFENMTVKIHPAAREVIAVYVFEEASSELCIQLPQNHPLGPTKVESGKCMISTSKTRQWIMQLTLFLTHQNGNIWDALCLWQNLINKKFEGVEECYICFAVLHVVTQQLPRLSCSTCKKKFHNTCLFRWFTTSNKSTCPICRNLF